MCKNASVCVIEREREFIYVHVNMEKQNHFMSIKQAKLILNTQSTPVLDFHSAPRAYYETLFTRHCHASSLPDTPNIRYSPTAAG